MAGAFSYYWVRVDGEDEWAIPGATSRTYKVTPDDAGLRFKVRIRYQDQAGQREGLESRPTAAIKTTPAPTAASERTIWKATLTVGGSLTTSSVNFGGGEFPFLTGKVGYGPDVGGALSTDQFFFRGVTYTVNHLTWDWVADADEVGAYRRTPVSLGLSALPYDSAYGDEGSWRFVGPDGDQVGFARALDGALLTDDYTDYSSDQTFPTSASAVGSEVQVALKVHNYDNTGGLEVSVLHPRLGAPRITGTLQVGETLSADTSNITDRDGLPDTFDYQWILVDERNETDIAGATDQTYWVRFEDRGKRLKVRVLSFTDDEGNPEGPLTSSTSDEIELEEVSTERLVQNSHLSRRQGLTLNSSSPKAAQGFKTGTRAGGYFLKNVKMRFWFGRNVSKMRWMSRSTRPKGSAPGDVLCKFARPGSNYPGNIAGNGHVATFTANSECLLAADTTYFAVVERKIFEITLIRVFETTSNSEQGEAVTRAGRSMTAASAGLPPTPGPATRTRYRSRLGRESPGLPDDQWYGGGGRDADRGHLRHHGRRRTAEHL